MVVKVEDKEKQKTEASQQQNLPKDFAVKEEKQLDLSQRTHGEKRFDQINWVLGYIVTFAASVGIAYLFRDSSIKFPFKKKLDDGSKVDQTFSEWTANLNKTISESNLLKGFRNQAGVPEDQKKHFDNVRLGQIITNTLVTFPGGFLMLPFERLLEKNKQSVVRWFNKRTGNEDMVAIGDARTKDHKVSGWGSLLLGRLTAIATVLASFMTLEVLIPKTMGGIEDDFKHWFVKAGNQVSKWRNNGAIMNEPNKIYPNPQDKSKWRYDFSTPNTKPFKRWHQMGELSAIDSIATAASVTVVLMANAFFKGEKKHHPDKPVEKHAKVEYGGIEVEKRANHHALTEKRFSEETSRTAKPESRASYREEVAEEKANQTTLAIA